MKTMKPIAAQSRLEAVDLPPQAAQAIHRLMTESAGIRTYMGSVQDARVALWHYFRTGLLRVRREGNTDVLGEEGGYRLLREEAEGGRVRYAMEKQGGWRTYLDEDEGDLEEAACHLGWHYLLYWQPEGYDGSAAEPVPGNVRW